MEIQQKLMVEQIKIKGKIPSARAYHSTAFISSNQILILGGCDTISDLSDSFVLNIRYESKFSQNKRLDSEFNQSIVGHKLLNLPCISPYTTENILIFGGWNGHKYLNSLNLINPLQMTIKQNNEK